MIIKLHKRHYGVHTYINETEININFCDVYKGEDNINEELLLKHIPDGFLPDKPKHPKRKKKKSRILGEYKLKK